MRKSEENVDKTSNIDTYQNENVIKQRIKHTSEKPQLIEALLMPTQTYLRS